MQDIKRTLRFLFIFPKRRVTTEQPGVSLYYINKKEEKEGKLLLLLKQTFLKTFIVKFNFTQKIVKMFYILNFF